MKEHEGSDLQKQVTVEINSLIQDPSFLPVSISRGKIPKWVYTSK